MQLLQQVQTTLHVTLIITFPSTHNIIRKNRNSVAVLSGNETHRELEFLGDDVFAYYGLGCRNVSKLYVPTGYDFEMLFEAFYKYKDVIDNKGMPITLIIIEHFF